MIRVVGIQALVFTRYRHDVDYSVFDVNCFPFHVAIPSMPYVVSTLAFAATRSRHGIHKFFANYLVTC